MSRCCEAKARPLYQKRKLCSYVILSKKIYMITGMDNKEDKCYIKIVLSLTDNKIVTIWANKVKDEENKQMNLSTRYCNINILSLK